MLDYRRLSAVPLLQEAGWTPPPAGRLAERFRRLRDSRFPPQLPAEELFPAARDIVEALDGVCIPNQCPELGLGSSCSAIEFDFFHYDASVRPELLALGAEMGRRAVFLGIGYDIAGDWLADEGGRIWFYSRLKPERGPVLFSPDIYAFLEKDICGYRGLSGESIF